MSRLKIRHSRPNYRDKTEGGMVSVEISMISKFWKIGENLRYEDKKTGKSADLIFVKTARGKAFFREVVNG